MPYQPRRDEEKNNARDRKAKDIDQEDINQKEGYKGKGSHMPFEWAVGQAFKEMLRARLV